MERETALQNIGQPFKLIGFGMDRFDTIRTVDPDGTVHGDFLEAHCLDCRLKGDQPIALRLFQEQKNPGLSTGERHN